MELTEKEISEKYSDIENKIPSIWKTYEEAGINLAQDIVFLWDVSDNELIRVISLLETRVSGLKINQHIDSHFAFAGLYPNVMKSYNILPDKIDFTKYSDLFKGSDDKHKLWFKEFKRKRRLNKIKTWMPSKKKRKRYYQKYKLLKND